MGDLATATREELIAIIEALAARVAELEEENRRLRGGGGKDVPAWVKPNRPKQEKGERKRRGQAFVRRREQPTRFTSMQWSAARSAGGDSAGAGSTAAIR